MLDVAILVERGASAFSLSVFAPATVFSGAVGIALVFAFNSFIGFEATAIFGEEARDPARTVPRATYAAVIIIAIFYALTSWALVSAYGPDQVQAVAAADPGNFLFATNLTFVGQAATDVMALLVVTSLFAALLATHNATSRYFFALGRERLLPAVLGRTHPTLKAPYVASGLQVAILVVVVGGFALAGGDPLLSLGAALGGLGTLGLIVLQAAAAFAVVGFFLRRSDRRWLSTIVAPLVGGIGLVGASVFVIVGYPLLSGSETGLVNQLPWLLALAAAIGVGYALWLRSRRPEVYAAMGGTPEWEQESAIAAGQPS